MARRAVTVTSDVESAFDEIGYLPITPTGAGQPAWSLRVVGYAVGAGRSPT
jgi:hypothetical protein